MFKVSDQLGFYVSQNNEFYTIRCEAADLLSVFNNQTFTQFIHGSLTCCKDTKLLMLRPDQNSANIVATEINRFPAYTKGPGFNVPSFKTKALTLNSYLQGFFNSPLVYISIQTTLNHFSSSESNNSQYALLKDNTLSVCSHITQYSSNIYKFQALSIIVFSNEEYLILVADRYISNGYATYGTERIHFSKKCYENISKVVLSDDASTKCSSTAVLGNAKKWLSYNDIEIRFGNLQLDDTNLELKNLIFETLDNLDAFLLSNNSDKPIIKRCGFHHIEENDSTAIQDLKDVTHTYHKRPLLHLVSSAIQATTRSWFCYGKQDKVKKLNGILDDIYKNESLDEHKLTEHLQKIISCALKSRGASSQTNSGQKLLQYLNNDLQYIEYKRLILYKLKSPQINWDDFKYLDNNDEKLDYWRLDSFAKLPISSSHANNNIIPQSSKLELCISQIPKIFGPHTGIGDHFVRVSDASHYSTRLRKTNKVVCMQKQTELINNSPLVDAINSVVSPKKQWIYNFLLNFWDLKTFLNIPVLFYPARLDKACSTKLHIVEVKKNKAIKFMFQITATVTVKDNEQDVIIATCDRAIAIINNKPKAIYGKECYYFRDQSISNRFFHQLACMRFDVRQNIQQHIYKIDKLPDNNKPNANEEIKIQECDKPLIDKLCLMNFMKETYEACSESDQKKHCLYLLWLKVATNNFQPDTTEEYLLNIIHCSVIQQSYSQDIPRSCQKTLTLLNTKYKHYRTHILQINDALYPRKIYEWIKSKRNNIKIRRKDYYSKNINPYDEIEKFLVGYSNNINNSNKPFKHSYEDPKNFAHAVSSVWLDNFSRVKHCFDLLKLKIKLNHSMNFNMQACLQYLLRCTQIGQSQSLHKSTNSIQKVLDLLDTNNYGECNEHIVNINHKPKSHTPPKITKDDLLSFINNLDNGIGKNPYDDIERFLVNDPDKDISNNSAAIECKYND